MARWKFILAESNSFEKLGELTQARNKSLSLMLNKPGTASFTLPMSDEMAYYITPFSTCIQAYRESDNGNTQLVWSGYVGPIEEDVSGNTMNVSCYGWLQRLERRFLRTTWDIPFTRNMAGQVITGTDDGAIVLEWLTRMNATLAPDGYAVPIPLGANPATPTLMQVGTTLPNEGSGGSTPYTQALRGKSYQKFQNALQAITEMTDLENGCDIEVTPDTRTLNVYRKRMRDLPNVVFGYKWGPNNLAQFGRQIDPSIVINYELATGKPSVVGQYADDAGVGSSQESYGLLEEMTSLSDVGEAATLSVYAAAEVHFRKHPRVIYAMTPFPFTENGRVPEPFVDYRLGDKVVFSALHKPRIDIRNQRVRVFGMGISIDENGTERVSSLQLNPG